MLLSAECYDALKCSMCNQLLSIFPIYMTIDKDNVPTSICGRCQIPPDNQNYIRNTIYEDVTKTVQFPCTNRPNGCMEDLLPNDMQQHELTCQYRLQLCCLNQRNDRKCGMFSNNPFDHYRTEHADLILENSKFEIDTNKDYDIVKLIQYDDEIFRFQYSFNRTLNHLTCILKSLNCSGRSQQYYAQINLTTDDVTLSNRFPISDKEETVVFNVDNMLNGAIVMGSIKININKDQLGLNYDKKLNEICVQELKCSQCTGLLYPFVYQCKQGHLACSSCKNMNCPKCFALPNSGFDDTNSGFDDTNFGFDDTNSEFDDTNSGFDDTYFGFDDTKSRFYTRKHSDRSNSIFTFLVQPPIKQIIDCVYYPCQFGCDFSANISNLLLHYDNCLNKTFKCPLSFGNVCKIQKRRKDLFQHILEDHRQNMIGINETISFKIADKQQCKFIKFSGVSFRLIVQFVSPHLLWRLETIDSTIDCNNYKFEITIFNNFGKLITIRESCANLLITDEYRIINLPCIWLHNDQLKDYINDDTVSFKMNIIK